MILQKNMFKVLMLCTVPFLGGCLGAASLAILNIENSRSFCNPDTYKQMRITVANAYSMPTGTARNTVVSTLGAPDKVEKISDDQLDVYHYKIQAEGCRNIASNEGLFLPVVMNKTHLLGVGRHFYIKQIAKHPKIALQ